MLRAAILTAAVCVASPVLAQDAPPKLEPVFSDDFSTDTRADYKVTGDVAWESRRLTLAEGASIERTINGGTWARVELLLEPVRLSTNQPHSEVRVWFILDGATNCYVGLRRELKGGQIRGSVALVDTGEEVGRPTEVVREAALRGEEHARLRIEYRNGLVTVNAANETAMVAYIENGTATVSATRLTATVATPLKMLAVATRTAVAWEKQQLADAEYANSELNRLYRAGQFAEAAKIGEKVLGIRKSVLGEQHPDYSISLNNLAVMYKSVGNYARAEPLYRQAIEIDKSVLGEQHPSFAAGLDNLAQLYHSVGDYLQAEPLQRQATDIRKSVFGEQHPDYARSLNNLAGLYDSMGDYARAEPLYRQAIEIRKSVVGEQHLDYGTSLHNLAGLYQNIGDYARAEPLYRQALDIRKLVLGEQHPEYASSLNNLAGLYENMGDYARAEPLYKQTVEIFRSVLGEQHPDYATSLHNLAGLYQNMGDYARAEPLFTQASGIWKSVLGEQHPNHAASLNNLAALYALMEDYARAEPLFKQATNIRRSVYGKQHPDYAQSLHNLAALYYGMGDYARAEPFLRRATDIRKSVFGEQHPAYARSLHDLAALYYGMGDYARVAPLHRQAVDIVRKNLDANSIVQSERQQKRNQTVKRLFLDSRLSVVRQSTGNADDLLRAYWQWKGAVTLRQQAYRRVAANPTLRPLFEKLRFVSSQLSTLSNQPPIPSPASAAVAAREAWRAKRDGWESRLATLTRTREDLEQQIATASTVFRRVREPLTASVVRQILPPATAFVDVFEYKHSTPAPEPKGKWNSERRYIAFVVRPDRQPEMVGLGNAKSLSDAITAFRRPLAGETDSQQAAGQAAATLREELWLPLEQHLDGIDTVVISPDTALGTLPLGALPGKEPGSYLIEQYRFASLPLAGMLRPLFDQGAERRQPEKGLLVLGDVNYDANVRGAQAQPKTDSRPAWMRGSAPRSHESGWRSLPGFQQELVIVRDHFEKKFGGGVTTLRGNQATEAAFIEQASRHYNLHLITHGFFADPEFEAVGSAAAEDKNRTGPTSRRQLTGNESIQEYMPGLLSGIVLAGANTPAPESDSDGILTASEIETLDLGAVDLVVLSACETGLGKTAGGEGLSGLQRAFHIAGARSCIATLWKVDDRATQELMSRFYRNYWDKGQSKIDALRNAQLDILRNPELTRGIGGFVGDPRDRQEPAVDADSRTTTQRSAPRYWAAFTLSGDWR